MIRKTYHKPYSESQHKLDGYKRRVVKVEKSIVPFLVAVFHSADGTVTDESAEWACTEMILVV